MHWSASGTGAWRVNLQARLGEAEECYRVLRHLQTSISKHPAPEDSDRVPSMEGNQAIQGITAGIVEMLLQSHAGEIEMLPALPKAWPRGSIQGLRARGGYGVDLAWSGGRLASATLRASRDGTCRLRTAQPVTLTLDGRPVALRTVEPGVVEFTTTAGAAYAVTPQS